MTASRARRTSAHGARNTGAYRGWDKRREQGEAVTVNIEVDLLPLWERIQQAFRGTPRQRLEAFVQYVHEHPGEAWEAREGAAEAKLEALLASRPRRKAG